MAQQTPIITSPIKVGISSCLVGQEVRFDGGHKQSKYCQQVLANHFDFEPICPEMAIGLGTPRRAIRLIKDEDIIRVVASDGSFDVTEKLNDFSQKTSATLSHLSGYVFCAKSPSCGMERVTLYQAGTNNGQRDGVGVFAAQVMKDHPLLPVEEDGRLSDPVLKENFITRVFCLNDLYKSMDGNPTPGKIIAFHSRYKYTLMSHSTVGYKELGKLVAKVADYDIHEFFAIYRTQLMQTMSIRASRKNNTNVLMHLQGYFKKELESPQKKELALVIQEYNQGLLPLLSPITLIKHHLGIHTNEYLAKQSFLNPYPQELRLRYGL